MNIDGGQCDEIEGIRALCNLELRRRIFDKIFLSIFSENKWVRVEVLVRKFKFFF